MLLPFGPFRELIPLVAQVNGQRAVPIPLDVYRRDGVLIVHADVPGVSENDLDVTVDGPDLVIRTERRYAPDPGDEVLVAARSWGERSCRIRVPDRYDLDAVTAAVDAGVLTLTVPARDGSAGPRKIPVAGPAQELTEEAGDLDERTGAPPAGTAVAPTAE